MRKALIVGGSNGIGLAVAKCLVEDGYNVTIIDKSAPDPLIKNKCEYVFFDLSINDYSIFDRFRDVGLLMITAGFGHLSLFKDIEESLISSYFQINTISAIRIIHHFYDRLLDTNNFYCGVMVSIAGFMSSPFFSVYASTKAALKIFIESVNVELEKSGTKNRILNVSPGHIKGTHFNGGEMNSFEGTEPLAKEIINHLLLQDDLFIPKYEEVYKEVLERYHRDFREEGRHSYDYKVESGRI